MAIELVNSKAVASILGSEASTSYTVADGQNRILIIFTAGKTPAITPKWVNNTTETTTSFTSLSSFSSGALYMSAWYIVAPSVGTGSIRVYKTTSGISIVVGIANYTGVHQTTPFGAFASTSGTGLSSSLTVVSNAATDLIVDSIGVISGSSTNVPTLIEDASQTGIINASTGNSRLGVSNKAGTGSNITMQWALSYSTTWVVGGVALKTATTNLLQAVAGTTGSMSGTVAKSTSKILAGPAAAIVLLSGAVAATKSKIVSLTGELLADRFSSTLAFLTGKQVAGTVGTTYANAILATDGLVAYWRMGESSGNLADSSGNGNTAYPLSTTNIYGLPGALTSDINTAIQPSRGINVPYNSTLSTEDNFSLLFWIKLVSAGWEVLWSQSSGFQLELQYTTKQVTLKKMPGNNIVYNTTAGYHLSNLPYDTWGLFTVTKTGGTVKMYLNGSTLFGSTTNHTIPALTASTVIAPYTTGCFDEMALFDRALTQAEIRTLYNVGHDGPGARGSVAKQTNKNMLTGLIDTIVGALPPIGVLGQLRQGRGIMLGTDKPKTPPSVVADSQKR